MPWSVRGNSIGYCPIRSCLAACSQKSKFVGGGECDQGDHPFHEGTNVNTYVAFKPLKKNKPKTHLCLSLVLRILPFFCFGDPWLAFHRPLVCDLPGVSVEAKIHRKVERLGEGWTSQVSGVLAAASGLNPASPFTRIGVLGGGVPSLAHFFWLAGYRKDCQAGQALGTASWMRHHVWAEGRPTCCWTRAVEFLVKLKASCS